MYRARSACLIRLWAGTLAVCAWVGLFAPTPTSAQTPPAPPRGQMMGSAAGAGSAVPATRTPPVTEPPASETEVPKTTEKPTATPKPSSPAKPSPSPPATGSVPEPKRPPLPAATHLDESVPAFHIAQLLLQGEINGDRAELTATLDLDINRDDGQSYDVPLRLNQAHILAKGYLGTGREGPVVDGPTDEGVIWRFSGRGTHQLKLKMWAPIRLSPAGRELVLSLPAMPPGFDAQLELKIPGPPIVVRSSRDLTVLATTRQGESTLLTANVRGTRLDLLWSEPPEVQTQFLQATTSVTLRRFSDRVQATAEQSLQPEHAGVKEVEIKLPTGFELDDLTGQFVRSHEPIAGRAGWRKVLLREPGGERIDLNLVLSAPWNANGGTLQFDGLVVPEARRQSGVIRLQEFAGYQMVPRPGQFVRRDASGKTQGIEAFEFTRQPFQIVWDVQRLAPKFAVRPRHVLFISDGRLVLDSRYRFEVDSGSVEQAELLWDQAAAEEWRLDPASISEDARISPEADQLRRSGSLLVTWKTPQSGQFDLKMRLVRELSADTRSTSLSLPLFRNARRLPPTLIVAAEDQYASTLTPADPADAESLSQPATLDDLPATTREQIQHQLRLSPIHAPLELAWKPEPRTISADAEIELRKSGDGRIQVQQTVRHTVQHGRLSVLRYQIPKNLLSLIPSGTTDSAIRMTIDQQPSIPRIVNGVIEAPLPEPRIGEITTYFEYAIPVETQATAEIPFLTPGDASLPSVRVRIPEGEPIRIVTTDEGWQPVPTSPDALLWVASKATSIPVTLMASQTATFRFSIERAFFRTRYDATGLMEGACEFHWTGDARGLPLTLPEGCEILAASLNGQTLTAAAGQVVIDPSTPARLIFRLPAVDGKSRLALHYRSTQPTAFAHRDLRTVHLPKLSSDVSVVRSLWELELPPGRHLFVSPGNVMAEYDWRRQGLYWSRGPSEAYLAERRELTQEMEQLGVTRRNGAIYEFSNIGPIEEIRFQTMTRSLIVLLGAGMSLALGFLFWSVPASRSMLALLVLAFTFSLLSLWFLEPIQLFLQPALLGAVLSMLATMVGQRSSPLEISQLYIPPPQPPAPPPSMIAPGGASPSRIEAHPRGSSLTQIRGAGPVAPTAIYPADSPEVSP